MCGGGANPLCYRAVQVLYTGVPDGFSYEPKHVHRTITKLYQNHCCYCRSFSGRLSKIAKIDC
jgi:hypothetical protein